MKKYIKNILINAGMFLLLPALLLTSFQSDAQRRERGDRYSPNQPTTIERGNLPQRRSVDTRSQGSRTFERPNVDNFSNRTFSKPGAPETTPMRRQVITRSTTDGVQRPGNFPSPPTADRPDYRDRINRTYSDNNRSVNSNRDYNAYRNRTVTRDGYYNRHPARRDNRVYGRSYGAPYRYAYSYPYVGQRFSTLRNNCSIIPFGGVSYRYYGGVFYRPFGSYFQVVAPPIGLGINTLPFGYTRFYVGAVPYYYYGNVFYRQYNNYYRVVEPPLGARLPALPRTAREVYINGLPFFEDNGTYYMEEYNIHRQRLYTVVGVNGVLDTNEIGRISNGLPSNVTVDDLDGDIYSSLPSNSKRVTINGQDYYRSPDDIYFIEISDGSTTSYQVVSR